MPWFDYAHHDRPDTTSYTLAMPSYAAFLGHQPRISIAELASTIPDFSLERTVGGTVALFTTAEDLTQAHLRHWGGIYLLARQIAGTGVTLQNVPQTLQKELAGIRGKVTFALRATGVARPAVRDLYRRCKELLRKQGKASRYIGSERIPAAAALLRDSGIIDGSHGVELVLLLEKSDDEEFFWVGRTVAAQDPDAYTKRDMGKPVRDTRSGLLPPKLAQVLINFGAWLTKSYERPAISYKHTKLTAHSSKPTAFAVYDPFCGTGVIPMEAMLRGWSVLASDASLKAVHGCEKNLEWLRRHSDTKKSVVPSVVFKHNALQPFDFSAVRDTSLRRGPNVIVTESHLGPPLPSRPNAKEAAKMRTENEALQIAFLKNVAASLPGVPVVVTWPVWYLKTGPLFLEKTWKALAEIGFNPMLPPHTEPDIAGHFSLLYRRPDQIVGREIVLLKARTT